MNTKTLGWISQNEFDFLYCQHPIRPVFYTLPKIHKSNWSSRASHRGTDQFPFVSPSQYVDFFIKPFLQVLPSYIRDSTDFINKTSELNGLPETSLLLTLDIKSLYTNISHKKGLIALRHFFSSHGDVTPPSELLIEMASYVLKYNYFSFDKDCFLQFGYGLNFWP